MENVSLDMRGAHPPSRLLLDMQRELPALSQKLGHALHPDRKVHD